MNTYQGNANVEAGIYCNRAAWKFESMEEAGRLPGTVADTYMRVPALALLVAGPILGLVYALFLPFIGFAMLGALIIRKLGHLVEETGAATARVMAPAWQPARAFLARRRTTKPAAAAAVAPASTEPWVAEAKDELARRGHDVD
jgi:hypothetical protein